MVSTLLFVHWLAHDMVPSGPCSLSRLGGQLRFRLVLYNANAIMAALSPQTLRQSLVQTVGFWFVYFVYFNCPSVFYRLLLITYSRGFFMTLLRTDTDPGRVCSFSIAHIKPSSSRASAVMAF